MSDFPMKDSPQKTCIVHAGMVKTGTTSIQSSLFHNLQSDRFRLLTLDSCFGNLLVGSAFAGDYGIGERFISHGVTAKMAATVPLQSRDYLDRALQAAAARHATPILSAEIIGNLPCDGIERLRSFLVERGWSPRVILYVRAPLDLLESRFQQRLRVGGIPSRIPRKLNEYIEQSLRMNFSAPLRLLDEVFGPENVTLQWFDPARFPGRCVVRHFCGFAGIPIRESDIIRENDSLSLDALRFVYALMLAGRRKVKTRIDRLRQTLFLERLRELRGPSLRFHPELAAPFVEKVVPEMAWVEARLGEPLSVSLHPRDNAEGVKCEADLLDFSAESLDWLAKTSGRRVVKPNHGFDMVHAVVEQLESIGVFGSPRRVCLAILARARELQRRAILRSQNLRS